jgi:hypothetical protein
VLLGLLREHLADALLCQACASWRTSHHCCPGGHCSATAGRPLGSDLLSELVLLSPEKQGRNLRACRCALAVSLGGLHLHHLAHHLRTAGLAYLSTSSNIPSNRSPVLVAIFPC